MENSIKENGYVTFFRGRRHEVRAVSTFEAQKKAAVFFKAKKAFEINVVLAEVNGTPVTHVAVD